MEFNVGDQIRCTGVIKDTDGANTDPAVVHAWYRSPVATVTTLTYLTDVSLIKSADGVYYFDLDVDVAGQWFYGFYSTGTGKAASPDMSIIVKPSKRQ